MKHGSLSKIFWGLFLQFFNINFYHLNTLTSFIGILLLATAAWQLKEENKSLRNAFIVSAVQLAIAIANILLLCTQMSSSLSTSLILAFVGTANMVLFFYFLFTGLQKIAQALGNELLGASLFHCFIFYLIVSVTLGTAALIPSLLIFEIAITLFAFIFILIQVRRLIRLAEGSGHHFSERALNGRYFILLCGAVGLTVLLSFGTLMLTGHPIVHTEVYSQSGDFSADASLQSVRDKMVTLGMEKGIVNDLPDSEVKYYSDTAKVYSSSTQRDTDGGTLQMTEYISTFSDGTTRLLYYYQWPKAPRHCLCDLFSVDLNSSLLSVPHDAGLNGFSLYDKKSPQGATTYRANFAKLSGSGGYNGMLLEVRYRVFGATAINQRGFAAFNARIVNPDRKMVFESLVNYSHQHSILNFGASPVLNACKSQNQMPTDVQNNPAYETFQF